MASYTYELIELGDDAHGLGCKCCRFIKGTDLPRPRKDLLETESRTMAVGFAGSVLKDWTKLNAIVKRFEGVLQKRWLKKSTKQRREILLRACPEMPPCHRPDFQGFRNGQKNLPRSRTCPSRAYLWPYINLEDLQQSYPILLFINSRGRHLPQNFISTDIDNAHLGAGWEFKPPKCGTMIFHNQHTPKTYGNTADLADSLRSTANLYDWAMQFVSRVDPGLGLLGLEIQAGIYSFLVQCVTLILHDVVPSQFFLAPHQPVPPPLIPKRGDWVTLQDHMLEAPYRLPQGLDLDRLKNMVSTRHAAATDHVWLLREDPSYFTETLIEWKEHDWREEVCTCLECWRDAAADMLIHAFNDFLFWHEIHRRFVLMPTVETQLARADLEQVRLQKKDEQRWAELDELVQLILIFPMANIRRGLPGSPRMRQCYPLSGKRDAKTLERWAMKRGRSEAERRVDTVFHAMIDCEQRALHQLTPLIQEAQYMLDTEPKAAELVDSWVLNQFADLSLLAELSDQMQRFKPWSDAWRICTIGGIVDKSIAKIMTLSQSLTEAIVHACKESETLYSPSSKLWQYPADKRPSKANNSQMRHAESHLDFFWGELEENVLDYSGEDVTEILAARGLRKRKLYRTPKWKDPILAPAAEVKEAPRFGLIELNPSVPKKRSAGEDHACAPKTPKTKTRGAASMPLDEEEVVTAPPEPEDAVPSVTIKVKKRTHRVFSALLPESGAENHHKIEVAWDDMLQAMADIGMMPEKLYGSVWNFKPTEECVVEGMTRGIQFHEPKEVRRGNKIGPHMVRVFGRRLQHAYGWTAGMFVCE
ncbi:cell agglutination protein Mam3 [Elasticomyces elasticus]|nr:cell agglutination protein Mam3 [Elasticomyces elasticus]